jgi:adenine-specific DNA-methyltransferase
MGITPMMVFFSGAYGKKYAPNTRETVRRQTVHQFLQAALIVAILQAFKADESPGAVYQIEPRSQTASRFWKTRMEK